MPESITLTRMSFIQNDWRRSPRGAWIEMIKPYAVLENQTYMGLHMICNNCGGEISGEEIQCPYCGWENDVIAVQEEEREIERIRDKTRDFYNEPEKAARKTSSVLAWTLSVIVLLLILSIIASISINRFTSKNDYLKQQTALTDLEKLYSAGDYEAMNTLLESLDDSYSATFAKYSTVGRLYEQISRLEEECPETVEFVAGYPEGGDLLDYHFKNLFSLLLECQKLEQAGFVYGEEKAVMQFSIQAKDLLKSVLLLTDEEIQQGFELASEEEPDFIEIRLISVSRLAGGNG